MSVNAYLIYRWQEKTNAAFLLITDRHIRLMENYGFGSVNYTRTLDYGKDGAGGRRSARHFNNDTIPDCCIHRFWKR